MGRWPFGVPRLHLSRGEGRPVGGSSGAAAPVGTRSGVGRDGGGEFGEVAVNGADGDSSFADGAGDSLDGVVADVAGGEDPRQAAFEG